MESLPVEGAATGVLPRPLPCDAHFALRESVARLCARNENLLVHLGWPPGDDWLPATALTAAESPYISQLMARIGAAENTARRDVMASFFFGTYCWLLGVIAVGAYVLDRRVPSLAPETILARFDEDGFATGFALLSDRFTALPADSAASAPLVTIVPDITALRDVLRDELVTHLTPLVEAVRGDAPLGKRALWLMAADNCAWSVVHHAEGGADQMREEVAALLGEAESPLRGRTGVLEVEWNGNRQAFVARASCCLSLKLPARKPCASCPLIAPAERMRRLREYLAEQAG